MAGILPEVVNGGLVRRDIDGNCLSPVGVAGAYCPPLSFTSTCAITALPSDCTARISAEQINSIVSELMCLAVAMAPEGNWNCASVCNLSTMFQAWAAATIGASDGVTIDGDGSIAAPYSILPGGVVNAICANDAAGDALALCMISADAANGLAQGTDGRLFVPEVADMAALTVKGSIAGGAPADLTGEQLRDSIMPDGTWVNRSFGFNNAHSVALTAVIPIDDTVPQVGEGTEIMAVTHTPKATGNRLRVTVTVPQLSGSTASTAVVYALFRSGSASAIAASLATIGGANFFVPFSFVQELDAPSTAAITFTVRIGPSSGSLRLNGDSTRYFGGVSIATITVDEFKA
jgi:hypothetical protein